MSQEVVDILIDGQAELRKGLNDIRELVRIMHDEMHTEHTKLLDRITRLEYSDKVTRWVFAATGGIIALVLREVIPLLL